MSVSPIAFITILGRKCEGHLSAQHLHSSTPFQALLLLTQLTKNNTNLQKIVAFENGYDHIFAIIKSEGYADGGVVVEDCLILMLNLLRNNPSNQTFFKEGECVCGGALAITAV